MSVMATPSSTTLVTGSDIQCGLFPSLAPQASTGPDLAAGLMQRRNTVVEVEGVKYEVGRMPASPRTPATAGCS
jgi:hypothetical protein